MSGGNAKNPGTGWAELLHGPNVPRALVIGGGITMHAVNVFIVITILPSVVRDIGGLSYFAWNTTLYVIASVLAGGFCARILPRIGARTHYRAALALFAIGSTLCALAPSMPVLLAGRLIQGLGAGTISALSYTMVRVLFPAPMWPTAISVISAAWGIATTLGPAFGGLFAGEGTWRWAFWTVAGVAPCLWLLVEASLPRDLAPAPKPTRPMAYLNLALLCLSVLGISLGSAGPEPWRNLLGLAAALAGLAWFVHLERHGSRRLMPLGATRFTTGLGATFAAMMAVIIAINTEIFVPYFLQTLHDLPPIQAGYLSALMSFGWTIGSMAVSGVRPATIPDWMRAGPLVMIAALAGLALLTPTAGLLPAQTALLGACLLAQGIGIGMCWPHICAGVFSFAPDSEKDLAAASITMVIMVSNALGSALAGMVSNLAGLANATAGTASTAAAFLFGSFILAPLAASVAVRRILSFR
jgi:MFS family permease